MKNSQVRTFLVLCLVFIVLTVPTALWVTGTGDFWLTLVSSLVACFVIPVGFRIAEIRQDTD